MTGQRPGAAVPVDGAAAPLVVVVVADSRARGRALRSMLSAPGFDLAAEVTDADAAEAAVVAHRPGVVLIDLGPERGGVEAIERIMGTRPTPVVVCGVLAEHSQAVLGAGAVDVVGALDAAAGSPAYTSALRRHLVMASRVRVITHPRNRLRVRGLAAHAGPPALPPEPAAGPQTEAPEQPTAAATPVPEPPAGPVSPAQPAGPAREPAEPVDTAAGTPVSDAVPTPDTAAAPTPAAVAAGPAPLLRPLRPLRPLRTGTPPPLRPADRAVGTGRADCATRSAPAGRGGARPLPRRVRVVVVGASTGGPPALATLLADLPADLAAPVLVTQHMADGFVEGLATWLDGLSPLPVVLAEHGRRLRPGVVHVAPAGRNTLLRPGLRVELRAAPDGQFHVPGVDAAFTSAAAVCGSHTLGVLLTGMGRDGAAGLRVVREAGGLTIGQDESTSVVYGMPAAAYALGAVEQQLPLPQIGPAIAAAVAAGAEADDPLPAASAGRPRGRS